MTRVIDIFPLNRFFFRAYVLVWWGYLGNIENDEGRKTSTYPRTLKREWRRQFFWSSCLRYNIAGTGEQDKVYCRLKKQSKIGAYDGTQFHLLFG